MFFWCVLRALNPRKRDQERLDTELRWKENTLNMKGIEYPVSLKDLNKFEKQNPTIYPSRYSDTKEKSVYPLRNSDCSDRDHNIILLLKEEDGVEHYCLVNSLSRLLASQAPNNNGKHYFCLRCLNSCWCEKFLS